MEIVLGVLVGIALHGHHFSIQEVDHEKQMFADLLASVHELLAPVCLYTFGETGRHPVNIPLSTPLTYACLGSASMTPYIDQ